jgi:hypothetical protein
MLELALIYDLDFQRESDRQPKGVVLFEKVERPFCPAHLYYTMALMSDGSLCAERGHVKKQLSKLMDFPVRRDGTGSQCS